MILQKRMCALAVGGAAVMATSLATTGSVGGAQGAAGAGSTTTATPIQHLVVLFQENVSFDHYFGTYPNALNPSNEPQFTAAAGTPTVNGLDEALLTHNPNSANPQRLSRSQAVTCDQNHEYTAEQAAADHGAMDRFVEETSDTSGSPPHPLTLGECLGGAPTPGNMAVMDYYDGNTVTAMWNYAQRFAMSDNSYGTGYGPSTPGAFEIMSGNPFGAICGPQDGVYGPQPACPAPATMAATPGTVQQPGPGSVYGDPDPQYDVCAHGQTAALGGTTVGDKLNQLGVTWGWFEGGFASPGYVPGQPSTDNLSAVCTSRHTNIAGASVADYSAHHEPFQYYASTANPRHLPPTSVANIGHQDQANHQYDLSDFWAAADSGNMPAVAYLKAAKYQDGHAGYSDPLDEQTFLVDTINHLQHLPEWHSTAVVIAYDDSDGWYDHVMPPVLFGSQTSLDVLTNTNQCGNAAIVPQTAQGAAEQARCGYGPRLPLLVVSPYARRNAVDHSITDQSSILRFIEDNWGTGRLGNGSADSRAGSLAGLFDFDHPDDGHLLLDPSTGERTGS